MKRVHAKTPPPTAAATVIAAQTRKPVVATASHSARDRAAASARPTAHAEAPEKSSERPPNKYGPSGDGAPATSTVVATRADGEAAGSAYRSGHKPERDEPRGPPQRPTDAPKEPHVGGVDQQSEAAPHRNQQDGDSECGGPRGPGVGPRGGRQGRRVGLARN